MRSNAFFYLFAAISIAAWLACAFVFGFKNAGTTKLHDILFCLIAALSAQAAAYAAAPLLERARSRRLALVALATSLLAGTFTPAAVYFLLNGYNILEQALGFAWLLLALISAPLCFITLIRSGLPLPLRLYPTIATLWSLGLTIDYAVWIAGA